MNKNIYVIDERNGKRVKSVWYIRENRLGKDVISLAWQYYRDRRKTNVNSIIQRCHLIRKPPKKIKVIYSGDPKGYIFEALDCSDHNN